MEVDVGVEGVNIAKAVKNLNLGGNCKSGTQPQLLELARLSPLVKILVLNIGLDGWSECV